jgi:hypothetical protein
MNDSIGNGLACDDALGGSKGDIFEAGDTLIVDLELRLHIEVGVLFGMKLNRGVAVEAGEGNDVAGLAARWRLEKLGLGAVGVLSTEDHTVAGVIGKGPRLEVAEDDAEGALHVGDGHELLEAASNGANFSVSNIDLFIVELLTVRIGPDFNDLANSDVELGQVWDLGPLSRWSRLLGWILLLLLLRRGCLFLFLSRGARYRLLYGSTRSRLLSRVAC